MGFAIFTFCCVFLLIASAGLLLFYRAVMVKRISGSDRPAQTGRSLASYTAADRHLAGRRWWSKFEQVVPKTAGRSRSWSSSG